MTIDLHLNPLGEKLGPCPCCHEAKIKTFGPETKGLSKAFKEGEPFYLKLKKETLYVDRSGLAFAVDPETGFYKTPRGYAKNLVDPGTVPLKLRGGPKTTKTKKLKLTRVKRIKRPLKTKEA
jgi:hypothetical protein